MDTTGRKISPPPEGYLIFVIVNIQNTKTLCTSTGRELLLMEFSTFSMGKAKMVQPPHICSVTLMYAISMPKKHLT
jgi:hypothetical protein